MGDRRLSINIIANIMSYAISTVLSFLITPFIVRNLGKEVYGFYGIANSFVSYITVVATALNSMAAKYITVELIKGNRLKAKKYFSSVFFSNVLLCLFLTPLLVGVVMSLQYVLQISEEYIISVQILFALIFAAMLLRFITSVYGTATYATNRMDCRAYTDMIKSALRLILYIALFMIFKPSIVYLGIVIFVLEGFNSVAQIVLSRRLLPDIGVQRKHFEWQLVFSTLKVGVWNSLNQLGDLLLSSSDLIMANVLLGEIASGNISVVKTMPTMISGVITAINSVFMPRVAHEYACGNNIALVNEVRRAQKIMGIIVTPIVMILITFGRDFFSLWVPGNDIALLTKLSALDVSRMMLIAVVWPVSNLNIVLDKVKVPSILVIASGVINILGMIVLTKATDWNVYVIVLTTLLLTILFYGFFVPSYPCKFLKIKRIAFVGSVFQMLLSAAVIGFVMTLLHRLMHIENWFDFIIKAGLCSIPAFIISILIFLGPQKVVQAVKTRRK